MGRQGRLDQQTGRIHRARFRRRAYLGAWSYVCAWIVATSNGWVPERLRLPAAVLAGAAAAVIVAMLLAPRPERKLVAHLSDPETSRAE